MIHFTLYDGCITRTWKIWPERVSYEQKGYRKPEVSMDISTDVFIEFLSILKLHELKEDYSILLLDGYRWEMKKDGVLISKAMNYIPGQIREAMDYISGSIGDVFIPGLPLERYLSDDETLLE